MDSYLIVFQENQIWYIAGTGPGATGPNTQQNFDQAQLVAAASNIGCRDPGSVRLFPKGLIFKSNSGFWLLDRELGLTPIGQAVKEFNSDIVSSSQTLTDNTQIIFLSESGTPLMYDSYYNAWSTFSNHQGVASIIDQNGLFNYINTSGIICLQTPGVYLDANGEGYSFVVETANLKLGGIQNYKRIRQALFEGYFLGTQPYQLDVAYNYGDFTQTLFYNQGAGTPGLGVWGESSVWGEYVWGADTASATSYSDSIQFRLNTNQQLCESIRFRITDLAPYSSTETPSLNALDLVVGVRKGPYKVGVGNTIG